MTNDERNPKPECRNAVRCAIAGFFIRISIGRFVDQVFVGAGGSLLIAVKLPSSQQRTKPSVTDFNSSQRARMLLDSCLVIWLSVAAVAMTASRSANSCTIWLVAGMR